MESDFIDWLRQQLPSHECLRLGPGDDAAIVQLGREAACVVTVDMLTDGVDFELARIDPRQAGRKALAVSLSDLAAMAARPLAAVIALALPRPGAAELAVRLYEGILPLAEKYHVAIAGGDTNTWDGRLAISTTLLGEPTAAGCWLRSGGQPGDAILATGSFGGSILGKHLDFEPRVTEALSLAERYTVHAAIDVSDGLSLDLWRLCRESGCGAVLEDSSIPLAAAAHVVAARDGTSALNHALADGEDFELILAVPPGEADRMLAERPIATPLTRIGSLVDEPGLWRLDAAGHREPLPPRGFEHTASAANDALR